MLPELKPHTDIVAEMVSDMVALAPQITDYVQGAVLRSKLEADALEIVRLQHALVSGIRTGINVGTFRNFDFARKSAQPATGTVQVTRATTLDAVTILAGSQFGVPGSSAKVYESLADVVMPIATATANVAVRCINAGIGGRTAGGTITQIISVLGFVATCTNARAILNGSDAETEQAQAKRFREYIASLSRGTKPSLAYAAKTVALFDEDGGVTEQVEGVLIREPFLDDVPPGRLGLVQVYIDNGSGAASAALVAEVNNVLRGYVKDGVTYKGWVAAGIDLQVVAVTGQTLEVSVSITIQAGYDKDVVKTAVQDAIGTYLQSLPVFGSVFLSEIVAAIMGVDGVVDGKVIAPTANVTPSTISRIVPGTVSVQEMV